MSEMSGGPDFYALVAATLAVVLLVDISVLWVTGRQVPELLGQLIFGVFGFYFGRAPMGRPAGESGRGAVTGSGASEEATGVAGGATLGATPGVKEAGAGEG